MKPGLLILFGMLFTINFCEAIEPDKVLHAYGGTIIGLTTTTITKKSLTGCIASVSVAAAKELSDQYFDKKDFLYTAGFGCLSSYVLGKFIIYADSRRRGIMYKYGMFN